MKTETRKHYRKMKTHHCLLLLSLLGAVLPQVFKSEAQPVTKIAAGTSDSFFIKSDGSLWAMGYSGMGQLGDGHGNGSFTYTNISEQIVSNGVTAVAAGNYHTLFLKSDGSLWAVGYDAWGQLGDGALNPYTITNIPERIVTNGVITIAAGSGQSLFIKSGGSLWAMGYNHSGELGDGTINQHNFPESASE